MVRLTKLSGRFASSLLTAVLASTFVQAQTPASTTQPATGATAAASTKATQQRSAKRTNKVAEPQVVQAPPTPPTPEQMAPVPPKVSYQAGQLTIDSKNATLAQVLRSVQNKTGASIEIPASANNERVVAQLGPGRASDVLASLLNGSKFDYIILGVQDQPGAVQKLILTARQSAPTATNTAQNRPQQQPAEEPQPEDDYAQPEPAPAEDNNTGAENQNQPPPGMYRPGAILNGQQPNQNADAPPGADQQAPQQQQGVKTPEQLLQELQRVQQQQQMYQQQLNPANQNPQPIQPQQEPQ